MKQSSTTIKQELDLIERTVNRAEMPLSRSDIHKALPIDISEKTLQRRLKKLVDESRIVTKGQRSGLRYLSLVWLKDTGLKVAETEATYHTGILLSQESLNKLERLETPSYARIKVSYNLALLENYIPNKTRYVPEGMAIKLRKLGKRFNKKLAAGTYAKNIAQRLLIDLSFNSSRLEGNTYSILDTEKLLQVGEAADGKFDEETVMILNHKEAILFLIENAEELSITPFVVRNLHQLLSQDLLPDNSSCGQIRQIEVKITKTSYMPLNASQQLEELFTLLLRKAVKIEDPFEQSFFLLMHLSYLQAFEDVNKRTARLSCNLPFIQENLCPLSFVDVPKEDYVKSLIYFYETGDHIPALEVFAWAYERSSHQYEVVEKSIGVIDSYRIRYRSERKQAIGQIIREMIVGEEIQAYLERFCTENQIPNADKFISIASVQLEKLHSGALVSLGGTEKMFVAWKERFDATK
ncbi:Fic family protein [Vibrio sp. JC009]|uniref:Fic family protein n=1 Tax=Vibrio sp. JC009 TaxID=2912314 RepID=UPI0023AECBBA|nr:Fic family protein [Vibrio sp. JC009]WED23530.1 Fic family protein [Vibrio sp. JC009]